MPVAASLTTAQPAQEPVTAGLQVVAAGRPAVDPWLVLRDNLLAAWGHSDAKTLHVPTTRDEQWLYTNLRPLTAYQEVRNGAALPVSRTQLPAMLAKVPSPRIVLVNGRWQKEFSNLDGSDGVTVTEAARVPLGEAPLEQLTAACDTPAVHIDVAAGTMLDKPLQVVHVLLTDPAMDEPADRQCLTAGSAQLVLTLGKGGRLTLMEHYMGAPGASDGWLCDSRSIRVAEEAELRHVVLQDLPSQQVLTVTDRVTVADTGDYQKDVFQLGARLSRFEAHVETGWAAFCRLNALNLTGTVDVHGEAVGATHDTTTRISHQAAATRSEVTQRNVLAGTGHAVFQGKFYVAQAAQKTDAYMRCENLLLSDDAKASQKPELEIYADDVKCSHGASTGGLHPDQIFYLRARGLNEPQAQQLLVEGFAMAALDQLDERLRKLPEERVTAWLAQRL